MNRHAAAFVVLASLAGPQTLHAQQFLQAPNAPNVQVVPLPAPAPAQTQTQAGQVFVEQENARETRDRLHQLLREHPPAIGEILRRDPTLARPDYLGPYPALNAFIQQHPEIVRNPSFFFGDYEFREERPRDRSHEMFNTVFDGFGFLLIAGGLMSFFVWLVRSFVEQRRWIRVSRTQAEVHGKLLDRMTNNADLLAYIQTPAGRRFLESGPLLTADEPAKPAAAAPLSRIIISLQAGVVLASLGIGFWIAQSRFPEDMGEGFFVIGTLATALGIGFAVSAALAYLISTRYGLVVAPPAASHD